MDSSSLTNHFLCSHLQRANAVYEVNGVVGRKNAEEPEDLYAHMMWPYFGFKDVTPEEMHL